MSELPNSAPVPPADCKKESVSQFRPRQRPSKARKRKKNDTPSGDSAGDSAQHGGDPSNTDDAPHRPESFLFKKAQMLRDKHRESSALTQLHQGITNSERAPDDNGSQHPLPGGKDDVATSLHVNFSVERSGLALEKNLDQYIESGFRAKFGEQQDAGKSQGAATQSEDGEFEVPLSLQVDEKPAYDPGEGLPAAGVEEVDAPNTSSPKSTKETRHNTRQEAVDRGPSFKQIHQMSTAYPSNLSADYTRHRKDWIEKNISNRQNSSQGKASREETQGGGPRAQQHPKRDSARAKRGPPSSDAAFAEKFRKRWRQK